MISPEAVETIRTYGLRSIRCWAPTLALCLRGRDNPRASRVPARWIRRIVGTSTPETASAPVLEAVSVWLSDPRSDLADALARLHA
jgi:hypothetical protein